MDAFAELVGEAGRLLGIDGLEPDADGVVEFTSEEATIVLMSSDAPENILFMTAKIMDSSDAELDAMRRALVENFSADWSVSLDPDDGAFYLSEFVPVRLVTPDGLVEELGVFASALLRLRNLLAGGNDAAPGDDANSESLDFNPVSGFEFEGLKV